MSEGVPPLLSLWTVYDHPRDYPHGYIARRWEIERTGPEATDDVLHAHDLESIREHLRNLGLTCLARHAEDEPQIVETWL